MRKSFCCVKIVLGKVSACQKNRCVFFVQSVCTIFSMSIFFGAKKSVCKNCSVQRLLCGKGSVWKNAYVPLFRCAKASLYKASVCKNFLLCVDTSVCKGAFGTNHVLRIIPAKRYFFDIFSDILSGIGILSHYSIGYIFRDSL